jgi:hypothetical protein
MDVFSRVRPGGCITVSDFGSSNSVEGERREERERERERESSGVTKCVLKSKKMTVGDVKCIKFE